MTLPVAPNAISLRLVNDELLITPNTTQISLNTSAVRTLAGVGAFPAAISMNDLRGKSSGVTITVTEGSYNSGSPSFIQYYGYSTGLYGSVSPTTYKGQNILGLAFYSGVFEVLLSGNLAQSFFSSVTPSGAATLLSSSATFSPGPTQTSWTWTVARPGSWDGTGTSTVIFI